MRFFEWRGASLPEAQADETLNRVIRKLDEGEEIRDPQAYCYGAARLVLLEALKRQAKEQDAAHEYHRAAPSPGSDGLENRLGCLHRCLGELPAAQRDLVRDYYQGSGGERIEGRRRLADALGIGMNALRIRAFRLTEKLQGCVAGCLQPAASKWNADV